jgi:hypothetical protein
MYEGSKAKEARKEERKNEREAAIYTQGAVVHVRTPGLAYKQLPRATHVLVCQVTRQVRHNNN